MKKVSDIKRSLLVFALTGVGGAFLCGALPAQPPSPLPRLSKLAKNAGTPAPPPALPKGKRRVEYGYKYFETRNTPQGEINMMQDSVWFRSEDAYLTTEKALYNKATKIATSPGKFNLKTQDSDMTANTGTVFFNTRDTQMRGQIVMLIRPRTKDANAPDGSARRQFDSPATITCEKGDYNWRSGKGILTTNLLVKQKNRTVTGDKMLIDTKSEIITIDGNVNYETTDGDKGKADKVILNYRDGAEVPFKVINGKGVSNVDELDDNAPAPTSDIGTPPAPETAPKPAPDKPQNP